MFSQSHHIPQLSADVELQSPKKKGKTYGPKKSPCRDVTCVSLKDATRAWVGGDLCACGEGYVWKEGKNQTVTIALDTMQFVSGHKTSRRLKTPAHAS